MKDRSKQHDLSRPELNYQIFKTDVTMDTGVAANQQ